MKNKSFPKHVYFSLNLVLQNHHHLFHVIVLLTEKRVFIDLIVFSETRKYVMR